MIECKNALIDRDWNRVDRVDERLDNDFDKIH